MSSSTTKNIFNANKLTFLVSKIINFNFISIKSDLGGKYYAVSSHWDKLSCFVGIFFGVWLFLKMINSPFDSNSTRSLIFEIITVMNSKIEGIHVTLILIQAFYFRHKYFLIYSDLHWIDQKVIDMQ